MKFTFLHEYRVVSVPFVENAVLYLFNSFGPFVKFVDHRCVGLFLDFLFSTDRSIFMQIPLCPGYCSFILGPETR